MSFKYFLLLMAIASAAAWAGWIIVVSAIDPSRSGAVGFLFFYVTLTLALIGTLTVAGTGVRVWARREELVSRHVSTAFRQAFLFTALVDASLVLLANGLFRWWTATLVIVLLALVELVFLSASRPRSS